MRSDQAAALLTRFGVVLTQARITSTASAAWSSAAAIAMQRRRRSCSAPATRIWRRRDRRARPRRGRAPARLASVARRISSPIRSMSLRACASSASLRPDRSRRRACFSRLAARLGSFRRRRHLVGAAAGPFARAARSRALPDLAYQIVADARPEGEGDRVAACLPCRLVCAALPGRSGRAEAAFPRAAHPRDAAADAGARLLLARPHA